METELLKSALLVLGGIVAVSISVVKLNKRKANGVDREEEMGIVFDIEKSITRTGARTDHLIIRFVTKDKYWITEKLEDGFTPGIFKKGEKVKVRYNKNDPKDFYVISFKMDIQYVIMMLIGACVLIVGIYMLVQATKPLLTD